VMRRSAYRDPGNPGEEGGDRQQECGVAPRQEQEDDEKRQPGSRRTASATVSGASSPVAMINRNAIPRIQPCQVAGFPPLSIGVSTLKAASISATPSRPRRGDSLPLRSQPRGVCWRLL
jgi:hypothetical protein